MFDRKIKDPTRLEYRWHIATLPKSLTFSTGSNLPDVILLVVQTVLQRKVVQGPVVNKSCPDKTCPLVTRTRHSHLTAVKASSISIPSFDNQINLRGRHLFTSFYSALFVILEQFGLFSTITQIFQFCKGFKPKQMIKSGIIILEWLPWIKKKVRNDCPNQGTWTCLSNEASTHYNLDAVFAKWLLTNLAQILLK